MNLTLTVVDTPGFGDAIDNSNCWDPVLHYVESRVSFKLIVLKNINEWRPGDGDAYYHLSPCILIDFMDIE